MGQYSPISYFRDDTQRNDFSMQSIKHCSLLAKGDDKLLSSFEKTEGLYHHPWLAKMVER